MKKILSFLTMSLLSLAAPLINAAPVIEFSVKPERDLLIGGPREAIIQIALKAKDSDEKRKNPLNLVLVLDRSGSMAGAKLEKAKQAACVAVEQMTADDVLSVVIYDDDVEVLVPPQKVTDREEIKRQINRIKDGGGTALYAGLVKGASQIRKYFDKERVNRIILLSDGNANVGPSKPSELAVLGKELREEGFGVSTIGLGDDYNEDLMTAVAEASRANYYYVKDAEKLPGIFREELGTVKNVVARNVNVTITLPEGVKGATLLGENNLSFQGRTLTIPLSEFYGAQTRRILISCEAPEVDTKEIELAKVDLTYEDAAAGRTVNANEQARIRQTDDKLKAEQSIKPEVASDVAMTKNRLAKEAAVKLADEGKPQAAADLLLRQATANAALPAAAQSQALQNENAGLNARANELQQNGSLSKGSRKAVQNENYMDRNSKR